LLRFKTQIPYIIILTTLFAMIMSDIFSGVCLAALFRNDKTAFNTTNLIRLHIMANSDSPEDQELKLAIRDAVLSEVKGYLAHAGTKQEVWQILSGSLKRIEDAARDAISAHGESYDVKVELGTFAFPSCSYGDLNVPAGDYDAVRVILGSGTGQNWWCVLFPPLCFIELADDGRIKGLDPNISPGEALQKLNLNLGASYKSASYKAPIDSVLLSTTLIVERLALSGQPTLSLRGLL